MTLSEEQVASLKAPLERRHVSERVGAGRKKLSYIEAWHAIREANRIFGFDGWSRRTIEMTCVAQYQETVTPRNGNPYDRHVVGYIARVEIDAGGVYRTGTGAGTGRDADLTAAHESAAKEAESDSTKRALMTYGNPFGLALYDKSQAEVVNSERSPLRNSAADLGPGDEHTDAMGAPTKDKTRVRKEARDLHSAIAGQEDIGSLNGYLANPQVADQLAFFRENLPNWHAEMEKAIAAKREELMRPSNHPGIEPENTGFVVNPLEAG